MVARSLRGGAAVITCGQNPDSILYVLKEIAYNIIGCKSKLKHKKQKNEKKKGHVWKKWRLHGEVFHFPGAKHREMKYCSGEKLEF